MTAEEIDQLATRLFTCIESGDIGGVADLYAPDVEVWHNVTKRAQSREENLRLLGSFTSRVSGLHYDAIVRNLFEGGFAQRHVVRGRLADGTPVEIHAALIVYVRAGHITSLFEYIDAAEVEGVFG
jgi:ketosteroid isomerase-like protein